MPESIECKAFEALSLTELYDIMVLRQEVFVVEQNCPYLDADGKDALAYHLSIRDADGRLIGYTRLLPKGISYASYASIGRVVTSDSVRGQGVGRRLMKASIDSARQLYPGQAIKISAQSHLDKFYESFGFQAVGEGYLEDNIPHIAMVLTTPSNR